MGGVGDGRGDFSGGGAVLERWWVSDRACRGAGVAFLGRKVDGKSARICRWETAGHLVEKTSCPFENFALHCVVRGVDFRGRGWKASVRGG
mgnify:CR=1 FL=1